VGLSSGVVGTASASQCAGAEQIQGTSVAASSPARTVSNGIAVAIPASATLIPPPVSPSYYEGDLLCRRMRCWLHGGMPHIPPGPVDCHSKPSGIVVLDFGSPCSSGSTYGTEMFYGGGCVPDSTIHQLVQEWISGYASDHSGAGQGITLASRYEQQFIRRTMLLASQRTLPPRARSGSNWSSGRPTTRCRCGHPLGGQ